MSDLDTFTTPVRMCISAGLTRGSINDGFTMCITAVLSQNGESRIRGGEVVCPIVMGTVAWYLGKKVRAVSPELGCAHGGIGVSSRIQVTQHMASAHRPARQ